jgi:hypothetical protein
LEADGVRGQRFETNGCIVDATVLVDRRVAKERRETHGRIAGSLGVAEER